eukprot:TRINITY_DN9018_c0_g1_i2.p1 TRINITY_DN9018_c0_g1~~TRINITY_DN9018_c0_g1_i2.p1  ORF type:complete len:262 (+),score=64.35 TRINITY_DN9018_c0_g1_i2:518-1303(+)
MGVSSESDIYLAPAWRNRKPVFVAYCMARGSLMRHSALMNKKILPLVLDLDLTLIHAFFASDLHKRVQALQAGSQQHTEMAQLSDLLKDYSKTALATEKSGKAVKPRRLRWKAADVVLSRCSGLDSAGSVFSFAVVERPGLHEFMKGIEKVFELYMYSNGMQPYVTEVLRATGLASQFVFGKGRKHRNDSTAKTLEDKHYPYSSVCTLVVDDCEGGSGSSKDARSRVWPKHVHNCMLVKPFDGNRVQEDTGEMQKLSLIHI